VSRPSYRGLPRSLQALLWVALVLVIALTFYGSLPAAIDGIFHLINVSPEKIPWVASRITAMLAYGALAASTIYGLGMTTRLLDRISRRLVNDTLHESLSFWGLLLGASHALLLLLDTYIGFSWDSILIPFVAPWRPLAVGLGSIALYLLILLVVTSKARRFIGLRLWRVIHLLAFVAFGLITAHGFLAGTESTLPWAKVIYVTAAALVAFFTGVRIIDRIGRLFTR
jgi:sulfoxide reductase heme-binding subunit YedZ